MNFSIEDFDFNEGESLTPVWEYLPNFIKWLVAQRIKNRNQQQEINVTIILHSASIIEGFLYNLIQGITGQTISDKKFEDRLEIEFIQKLENASWQNYQDLFKIRFNGKMSEFTTNENWKAITQMFIFRNLLTHGKTIIMDHQAKNNYEPIFNNKYANLYNYFKEVGLINTSASDFNPHTVDILSNEIADFFFEQTKIFIKQLYQKIIMKHYRKYLIAESYRFAFTGKFK